MVLLLAVVGVAEVFQQIPLAVTALPPGLEIVPPLDAVVPVRLLIAVVVIDGKEEL